MSMQVQSHLEQLRVHPPVSLQLLLTSVNLSLAAQGLLLVACVAWSAAAPVGAVKAPSAWETVVMNCGHDTNTC